MPQKNALEPAGEFWLNQGGKDFLGGIRFALLEKIDQTGSITKAGKAVGISYRTAWDTVDRLNALSETPLVESVSGGKKGGGTRLTTHGRDLLKKFSAFREEHGKYLEGMRRNIRDFDRFERLARKIALKISARNQVWGMVESIRATPLKAWIALRVDGRERLNVEITRAALDGLGLKKGMEAYALIKANWIRLATVPPRHKAPGENRLRGRIGSVRRENGDAEASLKISETFSLVISMSGQDANAARWKEGMEYYALFDASDVILGVTQ